MPQLKVVAGKYYKYINLEPYSNDSYKVTFGFDRALIDEIKNMEGSNWHPTEKFWTIKKSPRNKFALEYLIGKNPYSKWEQPVQQFKPNRDCLRSHQVDMYRIGMTVRQAILAAEPGVGKTLSAIEIMEHSGFDDWLWCGPRSALRAVEQEFDKWKSMIFPKMVTYDGLKKIVSTYSGPVYKGVMFDEAQKLRNITTQRYQAAKYLTDNMRIEYPDPYIIELTGTPSPHDPSNYWGLCEIVCPGWIKEGHPNKLKKRLAFIKQKESLVGGFFPELVTWWDDENKCRICGKFKDDPAHNEDFISLGYEYHEFEKSINEVQNLYYRLKGLVSVWLKKDVLKELPDKIFRTIKCEPSPEVLRAAKLIVANAKNVVSGIILLRELSDGFLYQQQEIGSKICPLCNGKKTIVHQDIDEPLSHCPSCDGDIIDFRCLNCGMDFSPDPKDYSINEEMTCPSCSGEGEIPRFEREAVQIVCPKIDVVKELLDEYDEIGRIVFYAGFQGSVDRICETVKSLGWDYIKIDGRGWFSSLGNVSDGYMLKMFQDKNRLIPRLAFIANPDAGGLGLTLTESPVEIFYSNSHAPESRMQAMERCHRLGMDINKGLTIIDIIHLPSDEKVLENLNRSQKLQALTLGDFAKLF